uniref:Uncharacterized protein n=1 Tax=Chromera velia CCMP2878 TaxID=1169474 RepID=A0A0G4HDH1_9ALVE|eukprot:Cvel_26491.t1-p1 / transcript=Cvel_26491.t1 / gene=Cvel_26491 / organism=Chromera_velia_CCMP2878 / gene_product=hypothetical protein / transcript_product=hypothetical protein / location=Cvel_scaffold3158:2648-6355(+) / protein_length=184 / sequence_SO=supercontig / SO=protein_coding / is_pseudo=false
MYTSPFGGWWEPPQRAARFLKFRQESSPPRRYYEGARYPSPSGSPSTSGGREKTRQLGRGFGSNVPLGGQRRAFSDTPSFGRRTSSPPQGSQPVHQVGPRRVAGVRTIPGWREDDRIVVPQEPEVFNPYKMSDGGEGEWETGCYDEEFLGKSRKGYEEEQFWREIKEAVEHPEKGVPLRLRLRV